VNVDRNFDVDRADTELAASTREDRNVIQTLPILADLAAVRHGHPNVMTVYAVDPRPA
jgi:hypothetical protein